MHDEAFKLSPEALAKHNAEMAELWPAFREGHPPRVPGVFNFSRRFYLQTPWLNQQGYTFRRFFEDPAVQWEVQLGLQQWVCEYVPQDRERGAPQVWGGVAPDFQNSYEAGWLGCRLEYWDDHVPDTAPCLRERKGDLASMAIPDPLHAALQGRALEFYQYFEERRQREQFAGRAVGKPGMCGGQTDGPFTVACNLRGTTELCLDLYEDPKFVHELLEFVTEATIVRMCAVHNFNGVEFPQQKYTFADDSIELMSEAQYREFVLPHHQRLVATFSKGGPNSIHLCGNVQRYLAVLQRELNIQEFDLGFPVDLGQARREVGPGVLLKGNLHPQVLRDGPPAAIRRETERILRGGVMEGRYLFCEGNNVAPGTPLAHLRAAYETVREVGVYA